MVSDSPVAQREAATGPANRYYGSSITKRDTREEIVIMALSEQQIAQAVEHLAGSHQQKQPLSALPDDCLPVTAADAMAIQMALNERNGVDPGGWKVGFTSAALLEKAGAIGPMLGAMPKHLIQTSPATFSRDDFTVPVIEFEIGYCMSADLPPTSSMLDSLFPAPAACSWSGR